MYNDTDIFIREIVSNGVDAVSKLKTLINIGDAQSTVEDMNVIVTLDKDAKTITVSDTGIGMTEEELHIYINKIAFSGANDFLRKYADANIIGHFGLGFFSSFMVSDKVEIITKSYKSDNAYRWTCRGTTEYEIDSYEKDNVGTDVIMHINDENNEYLNTSKIKSILNTYAKFLSVKVYFKETPEAEPIKITSDRALWTLHPTSLTDDDYIAFYKELYPSRPEPLFWIHLNIDTPFTFKGILYFPAFDPQRPIFEHNHLSLYCNQVFVTNNVDTILPDYLSLLHGIIDSPDIPLNVSRSFLQNDSNVKKISSYISTKVISALKTLMTKDRVKYEEKWDTIKLFINLGVVTVPEVMEKAKDIILLTDTDGHKYTFDEYYDTVKDTQKNKYGEVVYLYTYNVDNTYSYVNKLKDRGYNVLLMNDQYSVFEVQMFEIELKDKNVIFRRVDADLPDDIIQKEDTIEHKELSNAQKNMVIMLFNAVVPQRDDITQNFFVKAMGEDAMPITITAEEFSRRMKEISTMNNSGIFIDQKPAIYYTVNSDSKIVKKILRNAKKEIGDSTSEINNKIREVKSALVNITDEEKPKLEDELKSLLRDKQNLINDYAVSDHHISELIDIALLQYGLLTGEMLTKFIERSIKLLEK